MPVSSSLEARYLYALLHGSKIVALPPAHMWNLGAALRNGCKPTWDGRIQEAAAAEPLRSGQTCDKKRNDGNC